MTNQVYKAHETGCDKKLSLLELNVTTDRT